MVDRVCLQPGQQRCHNGLYSLVISPVLTYFPLRLSLLGTAVSHDHLHNSNSLIDLFISWVHEGMPIVASPVAPDSQAHM